MSKITVSIDLTAPISEVWEKYTKPEHIIRWSFASDDWECTSAENDLRVGGKFKNHLGAKDKSFEFDFPGTYTEVILEKSIKYTMDDDRKVEITFTQRDAKTVNVTVIFDAESTNSVELQQNGWQAFLDNFKKHVEGK